MAGFLRRNLSESSWTARRPKSEQRANSCLMMLVTSRNGSYIFNGSSKDSCMMTFDDFWIVPAWLPVSVVFLPFDLCSSTLRRWFAKFQRHAF